MLEMNEAALERLLTSERNFSVTRREADHLADLLKEANSKIATLTAELGTHVDQETALRRQLTTIELARDSVASLLLTTNREHGSAIIAFTKLWQIAREFERMPYKRGRELGNVLARMKIAVRDSEQYTDQIPF